MAVKRRSKHDLTAGNRFTPITHYNLVRKFSPMPQAMKIPNAKDAWTRNGTISTGKSQNEVILESTLLH